MFSGLRLSALAPPPEKGEVGRGWLVTNYYSLNVTFLLNGLLSNTLNVNTKYVLLSPAAEHLIR